MCRARLLSLNLDGVKKRQDYVQGWTLSLNLDGVKKRQFEPGRGEEETGPCAGLDSEFEPGRGEEETVRTWTG
ncbi:hypothetical protein P7K49_009148 [Saguinus oedipus]|uniref:Uncharacterized protein n=1 Tax=Saguinus oedipus TaxID=9490 RepID=A0ABQ9VM87_SAGOE|nr:hypothetical protein P7K49_009148 [Saguinus oedipus]